MTTLVDLEPRAFWQRFEALNPAVALDAASGHPGGKAASTPGDRG